MSKKAVLLIGDTMHLSASLMAILASKDENFIGVVEKQAEVAAAMPEPPVPTVPVPVTYTLLEALRRSGCLYRAARAFDEHSVLVSDGHRFWFAHAKSLFVSMFTCREWAAEHERHDWRPIIGSESGWRLE